MQRHFEKELDSLKTTLIRMGSLVEEAVRKAVDSLTNRDKALAEKVIAEDERVNNLEIQIDQGIIDLLALQQPVAIDLRLILAAQKINNDLERIGDHAVNVAESALKLLSFPKSEHVPDLSKMVQLTRSMLQNALDGFIHQDPKLGRQVLAQDDTMDELNRAMVTEAMQRMKNDSGAIESGLEVIRISRNLERIADLATNIAEEVIFIAQARVVKHHAEHKS